MRFLKIQVLESLIQRKPEGEKDDDNHETTAKQQVKAEAWELGYGAFTKTHFLFGILWLVDLLKQLVK